MNLKRVPYRRNAHIAKALDPIRDISLARLEGAMDRIAGAHEAREFAMLVDQRDALLAIA